MLENMWVGTMGAVAVTLVIFYGLSATQGCKSTAS